MREIRRNLGIGIGIAASVQVGHCNVVHRSDRRMRSERRRIGGAFQATIDPLYRQCGGRRRLHPGGPFAAPLVRSFAFRLSRFLGCISPHRTRASSTVSLLRRIKARRCTIRAFGGPFVSPLIHVILYMYSSIIQN